MPPDSSVWSPLSGLRCLSGLSLGHTNDVGAINCPDHIFEGVEFGIVENEWWNWIRGRWYVNMVGVERGGGE